MIRKRTTLTSSEKCQRLFWILAGIVLLHAGEGVLLYLLQDTVPKASGVFRLFDTVSLQWGSWGWLLLFAVLFFAGFSAIGQPLTILVLMCYGVGMGVTILGQLRTSGSFLLHSVGLLICFVPLSVIFVVAARESLRFSAKSACYLFRDEPADNMYHHLRMYCLRFLVLLIFLMALLVGCRFLCIAQI